MKKSMIRIFAILCLAMCMFSCQMETPVVVVEKASLSFTLSSNGKIPVTFADSAEVTISSGDVARTMLIDKDELTSRQVFTDVDPGTYEVSAYLKDSGGAVIGNAVSKSTVKAGESASVDLAVDWNVHGRLKVSVIGADDPELTPNVQKFRVTLTDPSGKTGKPAVFNRIDYPNYYFNDLIIGRWKVRLEGLSDQGLTVFSREKSILIKSGSVNSLEFTMANRIGYGSLKLNVQGMDFHADTRFIVDMHNAELGATRTLVVQANPVIGYEITGLDAGEWTIGVRALAPTGEMLAVGNSNAAIRIGEVSDVTVNVASAGSVGAVNIKAIGYSSSAKLSVSVMRDGFLISKQDLVYDVGYGYGNAGHFGTLILEAGEYQVTIRDGSTAETKNVTVAGGMASVIYIDANRHYDDDKTSFVTGPGVVPYILFTSFGDIDASVNDKAVFDVKLMNMSSDLGQAEWYLDGKKVAEGNLHYEISNIELGFASHKVSFVYRTESEIYATSQNFRMGAGDFYIEPGTAPSAELQYGDELACDVSVTGNTEGWTFYWKLNGDVYLKAAGYSTLRARADMDLYRYADNTGALKIQYVAFRSQKEIILAEYDTVFALSLPTMKLSSTVVEPTDTLSIVLENANPLFLKDTETIWKCTFPDGTFVDIGRGQGCVDWILPSDIKHGKAVISAEHVIAGTDNVVAKSSPIEIEIQDVYVMEIDPEKTTVRGIVGKPFTAALKDAPKSAGWTFKWMLDGEAVSEHSLAEFNVPLTFGEGQHDISFIAVSPESEIHKGSLTVWIAVDMPTVSMTVADASPAEKGKVVLETSLSFSDPADPGKDAPYIYRYTYEPVSGSVPPVEMNIGNDTGSRIEYSYGDIHQVVRFKVSVYDMAGNFYGNASADHLFGSFSIKGSDRVYALSDKDSTALSRYEIASDWECADMDEVKVLWYRNDAKVYASPYADIEFSVKSKQNDVIRADIYNAEDSLLASVSKTVSVCPYSANDMSASSPDVGLFTRIYSGMSVRTTQYWNDSRREIVIVRYDNGLMYSSEPVKGPDDSDSYPYPGYGETCYVTLPSNLPEGKADLILAVVDDGYVRNSNSRHVEVIKKGDEPFFLNGPYKAYRLGGLRLDVSGSGPTGSCSWYVDGKELTDPWGDPAYGSSYEYYRIELSPGVHYFQAKAGDKVSNKLPIEIFASEPVCREMEVYHDTYEGRNSVNYRISIETDNYDDNLPSNIKYSVFYGTDGVTWTHHRDFTRGFDIYGNIEDVPTRYPWMIVKVDVIDNDNGVVYKSFSRSITLGKVKIAGPSYIFPGLVAGDAIKEELVATCDYPEFNYDDWTYEWYRSYNDYPYEPGYPAPPTAGVLSRDRKAVVEFSHDDYHYHEGIMITLRSKVNDKITLRTDYRADSPSDYRQETQPVIEIVGLTEGQSVKRGEAYGCTFKGPLPNDGKVEWMIIDCNGVRHRFADGRFPSDLPLGKATVVADAIRNDYQWFSRHSLNITIIE